AAVVVRPREVERAGLACRDEERDVRVGGDRRRQLGAEHLLAVVGAGELVEDLARDHLAGGVAALAGLHDMGDEGLHFDDLAFLDARREADAGGGHEWLLMLRAAQPPHPPMVTLASARSDHTLPSLISA